jgi:benzodiazapine receptor
MTQRLIARRSFLMLARHPFLISLGVCVLAAVGEGIFAGKGAMKWLATLRQPRFAPPSWAWIIIGVLYYLICFLVLARLLGIDSDDPLRSLSIALMLALLVTNAFFNYVLFRLRYLYASVAVFVPYDLTAIALTISLFLLDGTAALVFIPYIVYLIFANIWGYELWRLNQSNPESVHAE